jgi:Flp pilus assembly protein TadD
MTTPRQTRTARGVPEWLRAVVRVLSAAVWPRDPIRRYRWTYAAAVLLLVWSTYSFQTYRILGSGVVVLLPVVGTVFGYLWALLLADELLGLAPNWPGLQRAVRHLKWWSLGVLGVYGVFALSLWLNSATLAPLENLPARITAFRTVDLGPVAYRAVVLETDAPQPARQVVLGTPQDEPNLYVGQPVQVLVRRGVLGGARVLRIHRDMEQYYLRMLQVAPDARVALEALVSQYATDGKFAEAMTWDATLRSRYPDAYEPTLLLGQRLTNAKRFADAIPTLRAAAAVSQEYEVLYALGYALAWGRQRDEAVRVLREATAADPTDWRAFYSLGYVYAALGRASEARAAWTTVLELLPQFPEVEQNLRNLPAPTS